MKALILREYGRLTYEDAPRPEPAPDEVLIEVKACGICGSDVHGMDGSTGRRRPPVIMGHEAAGIIAETGGNVSGWDPGDRVTFDSTVYCGNCGFCRRGEINLCDNRRVLGVSCEEYRRDGAFAEFVSVPAHILYRLPDGLGFEQAAMVEGLSIAFHAVHRARLHLGDTVAVFGAGMIGLLMVQALRLAGCGSIAAVDIDPDRLKQALALGADVALNASQVDAPAEIRRLTNGDGAQAVFEAVGMEETVLAALASVRKGGQAVLVGNLSPSIGLPLQGVVTREIVLSGSCASRGEYPASLDMLARGAVKVDCLISATAPLSEGDAWFQRLYRKEPGLMKVLLAP